MVQRNTGKIHTHRTGDWSRKSNQKTGVKISRQIKIIFEKIGFHIGIL